MSDFNYMISMQRDQESLTSNDLITAYESGVAALQESIQGMTSEELVARPIPGKWSTLEVVCHIVGCDIYISDRIERTIALELPLLVGVDERPYPTRLKYALLDVDEEIALLTALRRHIARILKSLEPESWTRTAIHTETGLVTLRQLVFQASRHIQHHVPFIAEKKAALRLTVR